MSDKKHQVFVINVNSNPLTPTNWCKAKKLIKGGVAKKVQSKFGTFGIQMLVDTRKEKPECSIGIDYGTRFEGYSVIYGKEDNFNLKLNLPDLEKFVTNEQDIFMSDDPNKLIQYINILLNDLNRAKTIGSNERNVILNNFTIERFVKEWDTFINEVVNE